MRPPHKKPVPKTFAEAAPADRISFLKQKYGELIKRKSPKDPATGQPQDDFDLLVAADPTSGPNRAGNYSEWIIKQYLDDKTGRFIEDLGKMTTDLALFDRFKSRIPMTPETAKEIDLPGKNPRDINSHNAVSLWKASNIIRAQKEKEGGTKTKAEIQNTEQKLLYKDDSVVAIQPLTWKAAVQNSRGTRWCTGADSEYGSGHFNTYNKDGRFLVIFSFKNGFRAQLEVNEKASGSTQLMNIEDQYIDILELLRNYEGKHEEEFIQWLSTFTNIRHHAAVARQDVKKADVAKKFTTKIADEPMPTKLALAQAANLSDEELAQLRKGASAEVERKILKYQKVTPEEFQAALAGNNAAIRLGAASNPYLPIDLMQQIVSSEDSVAKTGLACNRSVTPEILSQLPQDVVQFSKSVNKNVDDPRQVMLEIAQGIQLNQSEIATLKTGEPDGPLQRRLLRFQKVGNEDFTQAINSGNKAFQLASCRNPNLPYELMLQIANAPNEDESMRSCKVGLTGNPNLPDDIRKLLMKDPIIKPILMSKKK
jgi:hypothetical protein